jgi:thiol:disulfide interchange protein DsbD
VWPDLGLAKNDIDDNPMSIQGKLSSYNIEPHQILEMQLELTLPNGYRAYEDKFKIKISDPNFKVQNYSLKPIKEFYDENTKQKKKGVIGKSTLSAPIEAPPQLNEGDQQLKVEVTYQACTNTYCLFPTTKEVLIPFHAIPTLDTSEKKAFWQMEFKDVFTKGLPLTFLFVFIAGLLTSFTPCVFPMIPITMAVLGRQAHMRSKSHNLLLSVLYVLGIAITYSLLGILAATTGKMFGSFISSPLVVGFVCIVFLTMALSMFGFYELQLPAFIRDRLSKGLQMHGYWSAFIYGVIAGIVASPCVGPVLVGILTYIAQTQNVGLGFWLMFVFALGMGQLFLLVGLSSQATKLLPKSGRWMELVKKILGVMMLGVCIYYLNIIIPISKMVRSLSFTSSIYTDDKVEIPGQTKIEEFITWKAKVKRRNMISESARERQNKSAQTRIRVKPNSLLSRDL